MMPNVQQVTIKPVMTKVIKPSSMVYTDEYNIYHRLPKWGYQQKSVNHSAGEYTRGRMVMASQKFMSIRWKVLRSWLRPHRGISQEELPIYLLSFFEGVTC